MHFFHRYDVVYKKLFPGKYFVQLKYITCHIELFLFISKIKLISVFTLYHVSISIYRIVLEINTDYVRCKLMHVLKLNTFAFLYMCMCLIIL